MPVVDTVSLEVVRSRFESGAPASSSRYDVWRVNLGDHFITLRQWQGSGPPLILVHGIGSSGSTWDSLIPELQVHFSPVTLDLRGHGDSGRPERGFLYDDDVDDLDGVLDALGIEHPLLIGHSFGGLVTLGWAARRPGNGALSIHDISSRPGRSPREHTMQTINTYAMNYAEGRFDHDETVHFRANFALHGRNGAEQLAVVSIVLEPGKALGEHTDSPEEILFVMDGNVEFQIGGESIRASRGSLAVVPRMVPHSIRNIGAGIARIIGFFPSPTVVSAFVEPIDGIRISFHITGGEVQGLRLQGRIRAVGADWLTVRADGVGVLDLRMTIETDDGALIYAPYQGILDHGETGYQQALHGTLVPNGTSFQVAPRFQTAHPGYLWLNRLQCIGIGQVFPDQGEARCAVYAIH